MGRIIIEIPHEGTHFYRIHDEQAIKQLLQDLEQIEQRERDEDEEDILGLWTKPEPIKRAAKQ